MTTFKVYVCAIDFRVVLLAIVGVVSARCSFGGSRRDFSFARSALALTERRRDDDG